MKWKKYLLLAPVLYMLCSTLLYSNTTRDINASLLTQKYNAAAHEVDIIADTLDRIVAIDQDWGEYDYSPLVCAGAEYIDNLEHVYAAAFQNIGGVLTLKSILNDNVNGFDPLTYPNFLDAIAQSENGMLKLKYTVPGAKELEYWLYYRWIPTNINYSDRYIVVAAVSLDSIVVPMATQVTTLQLVNIAVTLVFVVAGVVMLSRLGHIWQAREGRDKWRGKRDES